MSALRTGCNQSSSKEKQLFKCVEANVVSTIFTEKFQLERLPKPTDHQFCNILKSKCREVIKSYVQNDDWKTHFENLLYVKNSKVDIWIDLKEQILTDDNFDAEIKEEKLIRLVNKTKPNKAPGPDGISINCVKSNLFVFLPLLLQLFNSIFSQEVIPKSWRTSLLKPHCKNKEDEKNSTFTEDFHSATVFLKFSNQFFKPDYIRGVFKTRRYPKTSSVLSEKPLDH